MPPSAWMTSQSSQVVRSPSAACRLCSQASSHQPLDLQGAAALLAPDRLAGASGVDAGNRLYSAVTQPLPRPRIQLGAPSWILAAQMTLVLPASMSTEPSAYSRKPGVSFIGLICPDCGRLVFRRPLKPLLQPDDRGILLQHDKEWRSQEPP